MALEFTDWELSPEETVSSRKKALDDYINIAQPMTKSQEAMERGQLASDVYAAAKKAAIAGQPQLGSEALAQAQQQAAELIPKQMQRAQDLGFKGAMAQEDILGSKQTAAVRNYEKNTAEYKDKVASQLAKKAFEMGYNSKMIALSNDAYLADKGLEQMKSDFDAGRITKREITDMSNKLMANVQKMKMDLENSLASLKRDLEIAIANKDINAAKSRMDAVFAKMKSVAENSAKASNMQSIISGAFGAATGLGKEAIEKRNNRREKGWDS